jgi:carboxypeptidase Q
MRNPSKYLFPPVLLLSLVMYAAEKVDDATSARMRSEELEQSQVMQTLHVLTDRFGPRVTGTPNHEMAAKWAVAKMTEWGMKNGHLEPWDFGHPGWLNEAADGHIVSPVRQNLKFEVIAWTPSTDGKITGSVIQVEPPHGPPAPPPPAGQSAFAALGPRGVPALLGPTKAEFSAWREATQSRVRGRIVLIGRAAVIPVDFEPPAKRRPDDAMKSMFDPSNPNAGRGLGGRGAPGDSDPNRLTPNQVAEQIDAMLVAGGALMRVNDAARAEGVIVAQQHRGYDPSTAVPTVVLRNDDFGRIERLLHDGDNVKLQFEILNHIYPEGKTSYNAIAEIPGTDKPDEIVMLGGHLDSWHGGTGATDNAIGCSIMMEAARLILATGQKPRRTMRVALWSGEEEGLLGSIAYVKEHFGTAEAPKPEWFKLDAYFNIDSGTGRTRGATIFGPPEAAEMLRPVLAQFADWGVAGAMHTSSRAVGGTDSTSFNNAGLPGVGMMQDPIEYGSLTHHTNLDTYERIIPEDVKRDAAVIAAEGWHIANRDQMVARFTKDKMPAPVAIRTF